MNKSSRARVSGRGVGGLAILLILTARPVVAQSAVANPPEVRISNPVTVMVWNRPVVQIRASFGDISPEERAERIKRNIEGLPTELLRGRVRATRSQVGNLEGILVFVDQSVLLGLVEQDRDPESVETLDDIAEETVQRIEAILQARADQQRVPVVLKGVALSLAATVLFLLIAFVALRLNRALLSRLESHGESAGVRASGIDVYPFFAGFIRALLHGAHLGVVLVAAYLWIGFVLLQFPYTEPWGRSLGAFLRALGTELGVGVLHGIPGLFTVLVIFFLTRMVTHAVDTFFHRAETGRVELTWLEADTARATRRMAKVVIWLFALTVAYPYIPGSETDAFKGVSVFAGLMVSLGAAGFVNQIMSGLVIVYARTFRLGDYIRAGDKEGVVSEIGTLSTKITTRAREEITLPNAVLVGSTVTNYTRLGGQGGSLASTTVTIGYDAPWRQVHALLELAARRTSGVRQDAPCRVLQRALSDFYVEYQLVVPVERAEDRILVLSDLHANIQDAFNEFGVQIMSPHFETQPSGRIVVAKPQWYEAPARPGGDARSETTVE